MECGRSGLWSIAADMVVVEAVEIGRHLTVMQCTDQNRILACTHSGQGRCKVMDVCRVSVNGVRCEQRGGKEYVRRCEQQQLNRSYSTRERCCCCCCCCCCLYVECSGVWERSGPQHVACRILSAAYESVGFEATTSKGATERTNDSAYSRYHSISSSSCPLSAIARRQRFSCSSIPCTQGFCC